MSIAKAASGNGHAVQGNFEQAREDYAAALNLADKQGRSRMSALNGLSNVCMANGDMAKAIEHQSEALKLAETLHDTASMIVLLNNIGTNHGFQGDHETALEYLARALALAEKTSDTLSIADALMNIGAAYAELSDADKAMEACERSLHIAERMGNRQQVMQDHQLMAVEWNKQKEHEQALELGTRALGIAEELSDSTHLAMVLATLGSIHLGLGQLTQAAQQGDRALHMARTIGHLGTISQAAEVIYEVRKAHSDAAGALAVFVPIRLSCIRMITTSLPAAKEVRLSAAVPAVSTVPLMEVISA